MASTTRESWPRPRARLRERPRAVAATAVVCLVVLAGSFGIGLAVGNGGSPARRDTKPLRQVRATLGKQSQMLQDAQARATALATRNARLARTASIQRRRAVTWKGRYLRLRRSRR